MRVLSEAVGGLERVLGEDAGGREREWVARLDQALDALLRAVRAHDSALASPEEGVLSTAAEGPSRTLERRVGGLHQELEAASAEAAVLRTQAQRFLAAAAEGDLRELGLLRRRAAGLAESLGLYQASEAGVILEATNTDVGAGD
jgi:hypothetical protein